MATRRILTVNPAGTAPQAAAVTLDSGVTVQPTVAMAATTPNAYLVLAPNGTGGLLAQIPDNTAVGGNARGQYAVDWQREHGGDPARVAAGLYSVVGGGYVNAATAEAATVGGGYANRTLQAYSTVSGGYVNTIGAGSDFSSIGGGQVNSTNLSRATVAGGQENYADGRFSMVPGGYLAWARVRGEFAFGSGPFAGSVNGQAQTTMFNLRKAWVNVNAGTTQELFLDGGFNTTSGLPTGSERFTMPNETVQNNTRQVATFQALTAVINTVTGASYCAITRGAIKNFQGTVAIVGTLTQEVYADAGLTGWSVVWSAVTTGATRGLRCEVTTAGNSNWIKAHASVQMSYINAFRGTLFP